MSIYKYDSTQDKLIPLAGGVLYADVPVGTIMPYGGSNPVDGFLLCQGQAVSRTTYSELFAVIGTSFGSGDGSTTFNVPDLRETVPVGSGTRGSGVTDHDTYTVGQFKDDQLQAHAHQINNPQKIAVLGDSVFATGGEMTTTSSTVNARIGTTTHGKQLGVNYIIKAIQVDAPADFAPVDVVESGNMKAVTSNAVAEALEVEDLTSQITMSNGTDGNPLFTRGSGIDPWNIFSCIRYGKMVVFSVCYGTFSGKLTSGTICFSGLPKTIAPAECGGSFDTRWFIDIGGTVIKVYFSRSSTELENTATRFQLVYFTE